MSVSLLILLSFLMVNVFSVSMKLATVHPETPPLQIGSNRYH